MWESLCALPQDVLRDLAVKEGHLMVGTRYWAKQALTSVLSSLLAKSMQHLLLHPETAQDSPETGALMVVSHLLILLYNAVLVSVRCEMS